MPKHDRIIPEYVGDSAFTHTLPNGWQLQVEVDRDDNMGPPWENSDGHGDVSEWKHIDSKRPGERVLSRDGDHVRFYDWQEAIRTAKRDGWDAEPFGTGTKGQRAQRAVEADFKFLQDWCEDKWCYVYLVVTLFDESGKLGWDSTGGIDSPSEDYQNELAREMAARIILEARKTERAIPHCKQKVTA